jgi:hypothetical protein
MIRAAGMTQEGECLPIKYKALSSNHSTAKGKKDKWWKKFTLRNKAGDIAQRQSAFLTYSKSWVK